MNHAEFLDIEKRLKVSFDSVNYFSTKMPHLSISPDMLHGEFSYFQTAELPEIITAEKRTDKQWNMLLHHLDRIDHSRPFKNLTRVALGVLSVPHSNASSERVFSLVRKNRTEGRSSMSTATLSALLVSKVSKKPRKMTDQFLRRCKTATMASLQSSSSSQ